MITAIFDWLCRELRPLQQSIYTAELFGSIARGADSPRDCDLLIVSREGYESVHWHHLRQSLDRIGRVFKVAFPLPLSVLLLTETEYLEEQEFISMLNPRVPLQLKIKDPA